MRSPNRTRRILCLWFPGWPIQRLVTARPELEHRLLLLVEQTSRGEFVRHCNRLAHKRGVRAEMSVSEARSLATVRDVVAVEPLQPKEDKLTLEEIALSCERFSFCIGLEENAGSFGSPSKARQLEEPECMLMDVTGIAHFFGGEKSLAQQIERQMSERRYIVKLAVADTVGAAWAAAHGLAHPGQPAILPAGDLSLLESLPVAGLRLPPVTIKKLTRLGIRTIRQLCNLDRASLVPRLGTDVLLRLDQLNGEQIELITPCRPAPQFQVAQDFEEGIIQSAVIEQLCETLLNQLLERLLPKRLGTRHLEWQFILSDRTTREIIIRLCEATANAKHISDLMRFKLEQLRLEAPLIGLRLEALGVSPLETPQPELFAGGSQDHARQFSTLLNRLSSRLGEQAVTYPRLLNDPVPERAVQFAPVTERPVSSAMIWQELLPFDRPCVLFPQPRRVEVITIFPDGPPSVLFWDGTRFEIAAHWGPERIESGWWQSSSVRRDYYRIETIEGRRLWLFRRLQDQQWFWHGEM